MTEKIQMNARQADPGAHLGRHFRVAEAADLPPVLAQRLAAGGELVVAAQVGVEEEFDAAAVVVLEVGQQ